MIPKLFWHSLENQTQNCKLKVSRYLKVYDPERKISFKYDLLVSHTLLLFLLNLYCFVC